MALAQSKPDVPIFERYEGQLAPVQTKPWQAGSLGLIYPLSRLDAPSRTVVQQKQPRQPVTRTTRHDPVAFLSGGAGTLFEIG